MKRSVRTVLLASCLGWLGLVPAHAHVPYIEWSDFTDSAPFEIQAVEQSKAVYAWLQTGSDVDPYEFRVDGPTRVFVQALVPVCAGYEELRPYFAIVGPGLPEPAVDVPFELPAGYGAIIVPNGMPGDPRTVVFEPFGGKFYYEGPAFDQQVDTPGVWRIVFWEPFATPGDYVAVVGTEETFTFRDILRALFNTFLIRRDGELHIDCD